MVPAYLLILLKIALYVSFGTRLIKEIQNAVHTAFELVVLGYNFKVKKKKQGRIGNSLEVM